MIISVASGKGGTGKTTVAVNLALSIDNAQLLDCDVEEPNAHLFLRPEIRGRENASVPVPLIDHEQCNFCGKCQEVCAYHALAVIPPQKPRPGKILVFPHLCHSCGACAVFCPPNAIREVPREIGTVEMGESGRLQFVHGRLNIGEAISPPLIRQVKSYINRTRTVIIDCPPGTSCPVIAAVRGSDFCLLVTEPTPFGLNDLGLAVEAARSLGIPCGVVINRDNIGDDGVDKYCRDERIPVLMRIPFDREIAVLCSQGIPFIRERKEYVRDFQKLFEFVKGQVTK